jgi:outer membrane protein assembly factor BamB
MMRRRLLVSALCAATVALGGCSVLDSINIFGASGPKMAELTPIKASTGVRTVWSYSIGKAGDSVFTPAVVDRVVFVAAADGAIARLEDGKAVWRIKAGQPLSAGVGADARMVVVGTHDGSVLAFDAADGKPLWQAKATSEVLAPPLISGADVIVRSGDNRIAAFDRIDGHRKWIYQRALPALALRNAAGSVIAEKYVFAGFPGGKLVALSMQNGALVWEGTVALPKGSNELDRVADIVSLPLVDGVHICSVAFQGRIACFDMTQGGALLWARDFSSASGLSADNRYVYASDEQSTLQAFDKNSGSSIWKQNKLARRQLTAPMVLRGLVVVADAQGIVHFINRDDGDFAARVNTDGSPALAAPQALGADTVLVQTSGGSVYALEVQ